MRITALRISGLRCFESLYLDELRSINVFTGSNNSGKSTLVKAILSPQLPTVLNSTDCRRGHAEIRITHYIQDSKGTDGSNGDKTFEQVEQITNESRSRFTYKSNGSQFDIQSDRAYSAAYPQAPIFPFFSRRNTSTMDAVTGGNSHEALNGDFTYLPARFDFLNGGFPEYDEFVSFSERILGFRVANTGIRHGKGKALSFRIDSDSVITINSMGDGVPQVIAFLLDLSIAKGKIFVVEEIENDLHPRALKQLLDIIVEKSETNQFFITTHSNIVLRRLGGVSTAKVFDITNTMRDPQRGVPTSTVTPLETVAERQACLERLGYEPSDFMMWRAWLFLEESSAETIVREYLLKWFFPNLFGTIRTFSAGGVDRIERRFRDFNDLFVFLHLEPTYRDRAWIVIDSGTSENAIIEKLRTTYERSGWAKEQFQQFTQHDFESYYPKEFSEDVSRVLAISDKNSKRNEKSELLRRVLEWIDKDEDRAKVAFEESAADVIEVLAKISASLESLPKRVCVLPIPD